MQILASQSPVLGCNVLATRAITHDTICDVMEVANAAVADRLPSKIKIGRVSIDFQVLTNSKPNRVQTWLDWFHDFTNFYFFDWLVSSETVKLIS